MAYTFSSSELTSETLSNGRDNLHHMKNPAAILRANPKAVLIFNKLNDLDRISDNAPDAKKFIRANMSVVLANQGLTSDQLSKEPRLQNQLSKAEETYVDVYKKLPTPGVNAADDSDQSLNALESARKASEAWFKQQSNKLNEKGNEIAEQAAEINNDAKNISSQPDTSAKAIDAALAVSMLAAQAADQAAAAIERKMPEQEGGGLEQLATVAVVAGAAAVTVGASLTASDATPEVTSAMKANQMKPKPGQQTTEEPKKEEEEAAAAAKTTDTETSKTVRRSHRPTH